MSNLTENYVYELPNGTVKPREVLFELPMKWTDGQFLNIWLFGLFGVLFLGALQFGQGAKKSVLYSGFGTFMVTFLLTIAGIAGGNQLIVATVVLLVGILANYLGGGARV